MKSIFKSILLSSLFICSLNSCSNEELIEILPEQEMPNHVPCTITIDLNKGADSRLALYDTGNGAKSKWEEGDGFTLYRYYEENYDDNPSNDIAVVKYNFTLLSGAGTSVGVFYCESTPPAEVYNYMIYYPSEDAFNNCSFLDQVQDGDGNMDHLSNLILMNHLVGHYTDIRFTTDSYVTDVHTSKGTYPVNTYGTNLRKNIILKIKGSNLPVDFEPTEVSVEISNTKYVTFFVTNYTFYNDNRCLKSSMTLKNFDKDKDFEAYMVCAARSMAFPEGSSIRVSVKNAEGETYYLDKSITAERYIDLGNMLTLNCNSGWTRGSNSTYQSTDFSADGTVHALSEIKEGNINVVFMGDGFSDRQIADGTYRQVMEQGMQAFLSEEPFTSYAGYFNIYYVDAVSAYEGCIEPSNAGRTKFSTYFGNGTHVGGDDQQAFNYTLKVPGLAAENLDNYLTIVMMNSTKHAGTCWMYSPTYQYDYFGQGYSVCYFPIGASYESLREVLTHEANGHGFGKLADEYDAQGASSSKTLADYQNGLSWGFYSNVDITSDITKTLWADFNVEPYISKEGIGVYEGAFTNNTGFYRSTENSIMRYNVGGFNAPSRRTLYTRINKLLDPSWEYDHEEFLAWDYKNIPPAPVSVSNDMANKILKDDMVPLEFVPFAPPVIVDGR